MTPPDRISRMFLSEEHMGELFEIGVIGRLPRDLIRLPEIVRSWAVQSGCHESTLLVCRLRDESELRGLLSRLWNLNLRIESVRRVKGPDRKEQMHGRDTDA